MEGVIQIDELTELLEKKRKSAKQRKQKTIRLNQDEVVSALRYLYRVKAYGEEENVV